MKCACFCLCKCACAHVYEHANKHRSVRRRRGGGGWVDGGVWVNVYEVCVHTLMCMFSTCESKAKIIRSHTIRESMPQVDMPCIKQFLVVMSPSIHGTLGMR